MLYATRQNIAVPLLYIALLRNAVVRLILPVHNMTLYHPAMPQLYVAPRNVTTPKLCATGPNIAIPCLAVPSRHATLLYWTTQSPSRYYAAPLTLHCHT